MSKNEIITLETPEGEKKYRRFSARLPEFLEKYPPEKNYRVVHRCSDSLSYEKGKLQLYEAAMRAGKKPAEVGLPEIPEQSTMIYEACLFGPDGETITNATAALRIETIKDWERGETAAFQRLLASLGFGGEVYVNDEGNDIHGQGLRIKPTVDTTAVAKTPAGSAKEPLPAAATADAGRTAEVVDLASGSRPRRLVPAATMNQIKRLAKLRKVEVPEFKSLEEALKFLVDLQSTTANPGQTNAAG